MFGSFLKMMGFYAAKPVHSRAGETAPAGASQPDEANPPSPTPATPAPKPARRSTVTAKVVKPHATAAEADVAAQTVKPEARPAPKPVVKPAAVPVKADKPVSPSSKKKPEEVTTKTNSESIAHAPKVAKAVSPAPVVKPVATAAPLLTALGVPVRSGRPSSRLAQLTVPSMAQSVASTAAKSSFTQISTVQPITPVLASAVKKDPALADNWKTRPVAELSDAEVIAMPDDEYMNDTQMTFFRMKLVDLKNGILNNAGETTEHLREDTVVVPDPADRATIEEEHALELRTRDRERKLLKKIEQSINRIDAGDYGYCDETGEPIGVGRLLARPTATLSLEAQQRRELKQKMFGD
jgi:DnaK suppressor protein